MPASAECCFILALCWWLTLDQLSGIVKFSVIWYNQNACVSTSFNGFLNDDKTRECIYFFFLDSSWRYSRIPRSSSVMLGSLGTELVRERRELERRTDLSVNNLVDHSYRNSDFSSSTCMYCTTESL